MMSPLNILRPLVAGLALLLLPAPSSAQTADELIARGKAAREEGRLEAAEESFRQAIATDGGRADAALLLAETVAWQKKFADAETLYRGAIARFGASRNARLGLGRVLLWSGRYDEARAVLWSILRETANDVDAREELARAFYWAGDFRTAAREFRRVVELDPARADSQRALGEIRASSAPVWAVRGFHRTDDQPFAIDRAEVDVTIFSDPLTRWTLSAGSWRLDDAANHAPFFGVESDIPVPSLRMTIAPMLRLLSFPDGEDEILGAFRVVRRIGSTGAISAVVSRNELLLNAAAADDHPFVTDTFVQYDVAAPDGLLARVRVGASRYHDENEGAFADAFFLAPMYRGDRLTVSAGMSAAYRDTAETRFRFDRIDVVNAAVRYSYRWHGVYDPYWTPLGQHEVRAIARAAAAAGAPLFWSVQVSGGRARDRGVSFGPSSGDDPAPAPFPSEYPRTWSPWTAAATLEIPAGGGNRLRFDYEHTRSVYYEADEFRASLVGRF